jgi:hypothetical protein
MKAVSEAAVVKRIKRKLAHEGQALHKSRSSQDIDWYNTGTLWRLTPYYIIDTNNLIIHEDVHLTKLGRELDVLSADEYVEGWEEQSC